MHDLLSMKIIFVFLGILFTLNTFAQGVDLSFEDRKSTAITVGFLNGGGLLGAELEVMTSKRLGAHFGFGFIGACVGLDYHVKPTIASSAFVLELRAQGLGEIYANTAIGLGYLIRYKGLSLQLGGSYMIDKGPNTIKNWNTRNFIPQVSLGFYSAF
jgi:hypothetical protein